VLILKGGRWSKVQFFLTGPPAWDMFAGNSDRADVNQMLIQYFVNYNIAKGR